MLLHRLSDPQPDKIAEVIISLVPQIDLLVVWGTAAIAAKKLAGGVPTVFITVGFPVELGLVESLAHPGGNMTLDPGDLNGQGWTKRHATSG